MKWTIFSEFANVAMSAPETPGDPKLSSLDLLRSFLSNSECNAHVALSRKIQTVKLLKALESVKSPSTGMEPALKEIVNSAMSVSKDFQTEKVGTDHLLVGILRVPDSFAHAVLSKVGIEESVLVKSLAEMAPEA